jgi:transcription antitermination factor NusG
MMIERVQSQSGFGSSTLPWYAVYTWSKHEKSVAVHLSQRNIEHLLPIYETVHRWRNGEKVRMRLPLFPGYVFVRVPHALRARVLEITGVVNLLGSGKKPTPLSEAEVEALQRLGNLDGKKVEPHPYLCDGKRVRVATGPLEGLTGTVRRSKSGYRFVVSVDLIKRSIAVELDGCDLRAA